MFDFFRDTYREMKGIDMTTIIEERKKNKEMERGKYFIFSRKMKAMIFALGVLYLILAGSGISVIKGTEGATILIIKYIILSVIDILICTCLILKNKNAELIALGAIFLFIVLNYLAVVLL